jgi:predicted DCC family thiol-disulfide oxidoreductase YuxK
MREAAVADQHAASEVGAERRPVLFYDGGCPLCRREIAHYRRLDAGERVVWVDLHADPEQAQRYGLSWRAAMQRIHLLESDGRLVTGAAAFAALWRRLPYYRRLAGLVRLPGVLPLLDRVYGIFARWRWRRREACEGSCGIR